MNFSSKDERRIRGEADTARPLWRKINLIDVIFIIIILLVALAAASFFTSFSLFGLGGEQRIISYAVELKYVDGAMAGNIKAGDTAYDAAGKDAIGTVTSVSVSNSVKYIYSEESGRMESVPVPANADGNIPVDITVTVQVTADYTAAAGYSAGGTRISVGSPVELCFAGYTGSGMCVSLHVLSQAG